jgi:heme exporter protein A
MVLLSAAEVSIERGERRLLQGVDLSVASGQIWQMLGANGVGKSSLLRALAGLARFGVEGSISRFESLLYLAHAPAIKRALSPLENLRCHPACDITSAPAQIAIALEAVQLGGFEHQPVGSLSAGQQRRVALARLLLSDAPLWLLDEPFTALDGAGCDWLEECIRAHVSTGGAVIFTSHQPSRFSELQQDLDLAHYVAR